MKKNRSNSSKIYSVSDEEFIALFNRAETITQILETLGLSTSGGCSRTVFFKRAEELKLNIDELRKRTLEKISLMMKSAGKRRAVKLEDVISGRISPTPGCFKRMILRNNLIEYKCGKCGINEWHGEKLSLQMDHIDGIKTNNALENIRLLCPNCHSLTSTFAGKNAGNKMSHLKKRYACECCEQEMTRNCLGKLCIKCLGVTKYKVPHPTKEELEKLVWSKPTSQLRKDLGVSDSAIGKWCRQLGVKKPPRGYWNKLKFGRITEEEVRNKEG